MTREIRTFANSAWVSEDAIKQAGISLVPASVQTMLRGLSEDVDSPDWSTLSLQTERVEIPETEEAPAFWAIQIVATIRGLAP